jgi:hypothetical protein
MLGNYRNSALQNMLAAVIFLISVLLSGRSLGSAFGFW